MLESAGGGTFLGVFNTGRDSEAFLGSRAEQVLVEVSVSWRRGECCLLLGPSGSGKKTLLSLSIISSKIQVDTVYWLIWVNVFKITPANKYLERAKKADNSGCFYEKHTPELPSLTGHFDPLLCRLRNRSRRAGEQET